jgi:hypothetical protein
MIARTPHRQTELRLGFTTGEHTRVGGRGDRGKFVEEGGLDMLAFCGIDELPLRRAESQTATTI